MPGLSGFGAETAGASLSERLSCAETAPTEFRRHALDLADSGRSVGGVACRWGFAESCLHRWRQREPYVNHLLRVTIRIVTQYRVRDAEMVRTALLHDAVEDHGDLALEPDHADALACLAAQVGSRPTELVSAGVKTDSRPAVRVAITTLQEGPWARGQDLGLHRQRRVLVAMRLT